LPVAVLFWYFFGLVELLAGDKTLLHKAQGNILGGMCSGVRSLAGRCLFFCHMLELERFALSLELLGFLDHGLIGLGQLVFLGANSGKAPGFPGLNVFEDNCVNNAEDQDDETGIKNEHVTATCAVEGGALTLIDAPRDSLQAWKQGKHRKAYMPRIVSRLPLGAIGKIQGKWFPKGLA
jgi:hypothetical protein